MAFLAADGPFWGDSLNIWWPEDRAWCVATDIDLFDTYVGGSLECIEAVLSNPDLEALPITLDARLGLGGDTINASYQIVIEGSSYRQRLSPHKSLFGRKEVVDPQTSA